jgi:hypothetical protein
MSIYNKNEKSRIGTRFARRGKKDFFRLFERGRVERKRNVASEDSYIGESWRRDSSSPEIAAVLIVTSIRVVLRKRCIRVAMGQQCYGTFRSRMERSKQRYGASEKTR